MTPGQVNGVPVIWPEPQSRRDPEQRQEPPRPCIRGHIAERRHNNTCSECAKLAMVAYRQRKKAA